MEFRTECRLPISMHIIFHLLLRLNDLIMRHSILVFLLNQQIKYILNPFVAVPFGKPIERSL